MLKFTERTSQAGNLVPAVGGGDYAHLLLPLLEALAEKEETLVRAKVTPNRHRILVFQVL
jgi:hypothetical protein